MDDRLEEQFAAPYDAWKKTPGPETNAAMLTALHPVIEGAVRTHVGESNPLLMSRARRLALDSLQGYDRNRGRLQTHLYNQLQGLKRINRQQTQILSVPERVTQDRYNLENITNELTHELGRDPSDSEIANRTGFSARRLRHVRSFRPAVAQGTMEEASSDVYGGVTPIGQDVQAMWQSMVYDDLDERDKWIMEHSIGMNGKPMLSNAAMAAKLGVTPGAVSQRKAKIQQMLDQELL